MLNKNKKHHYPAVLELMADLISLCKVAGHADDTIVDTVAEYDTFKKRL